MVLFAAPQLAVQGAVREGTSVVGGEHDEGVVGYAGILNGGEKLADLIIHVLDEGDVGGALLVEVRFALLNFLKPILGRLD